MIGRRWLLPLGWAALILALTSIPGSAVPDVGGSSTDKLVHLVLYGVLGGLILQAVWAAERPVRSILLATLLASVFGVVDELHQTLIPGRSAEALDWLADSIGGMTGALVAVVIRWGGERTA